MTTIPPPPSEPPTVGMPDPDPEPEPVTEWWRKSWPPIPPQHTTKPAEPVDLHKDNTDTEDQAVEDDDQEQAEAGTAGESDTARRVWVSEFADALAQRLGARIGTILTETPEERAERERVEHEAKYEAKGETEQERRNRHRREAIVRRQRASILWHQTPNERTRRFRRWCILTAASAAAGYLLHLPQILTGLPLPVGVGAVFLGWVLDLKMRGGGHVRVTQVRGPAVLYLCAVRVPLASALLALLGLTPLFALTN
ncbi:hypothetical protein ACIRRH_41170 [Kitasatospora sp. NPDC101235]|uniref:hypothetical protein n=1 Tax=Kitasatospora sp. NPDC101235 TaxID=3364101 RepID=UPI0038086DB8